MLGENFCSSLTAIRRLKAGGRTRQPRRSDVPEGHSGLAFVWGVSFTLPREMSIFATGDVSFLISGLFSFTENTDAYASVHVYATTLTLVYMHTNTHKYKDVHTCISKRTQRHTHAVNSFILLFSHSYI